MPILGRWLPGRRRELVLVTLLYIGLLSVAVWQRSSAEGLSIVLFTLEFGLPVTLSIVASGLIANDPVLDLLLSVSQPSSRTLAQRLAALLGYGLLLAALMLLAAAWLELNVPIAGIGAVLIWATPTALFVGVATAGSLLRGRMLDGVVLTLSTSWMTLLSLTVQSDCPLDPGHACHAALVTPLMTLARPHDPLWLANRLLWLAVGGGLVVAGLRLVQQEERLVMAAQAAE